MNKFRILITGCSTGLGFHLANKFENEGHFVFRHLGRNHFDLTNQSDISRLCKEAKNLQIDVLINNAAVVCPNIALGQYEHEIINSMIDVNLRAPILITKNLLPNLKRIININSMVGLEVKSPRTLYSASKWGLRGFSNSLKKENKRISILDVYPTNIKTTPDRINAMDVDIVVDKIYNAFLTKKQELILDGRKK